MSVQQAELGIFKGFGQGLLGDYPQREPLGTPLFGSNWLFLAALAFPACRNPHFLAEALLICWVAGKEQLLGGLKELHLQRSVPPAVAC